MVARGTLDAERHAYRREKDVAVEVMRKLFLGHLFRCLGGYVVGLGTSPCHGLYECPWCARRFARGWALGDLSH